MHEVPFFSLFKSIENFSWFLKNVQLLPKSTKNVRFLGIQLGETSLFNGREWRRVIDCLVSRWGPMQMIVTDFGMERCKL